MSEDEFVACIMVNLDGEIELILPVDFPDDPNDPVYFLMGVYYLAENDPDFYASVLESIKGNKEFKKHIEPEEILH